MFRCAFLHLCSGVRVFRHVHMTVQYSGFVSNLPPYSSPFLLCLFPVARLRQWDNTQSHGLPGFKDLHCVRRRLWLPVRPHTCSGAHGPLCGCRNARLRPPRADQCFPCGHQRPTGTHATQRKMENSMKQSQY